jgi:class 3 adenylate cyclase/DNA-binding CsgD family transcriptional regulator/tetratricopeptide (TPR) repeat protein
MGVEGLIVVLFTDLVGSTELLERLGDDEAERLRRGHFGALRSAVEEHAGQEVKTLGDGLMAVFRSALGAVACAKAMQSAPAPRDPSGEVALQIRVGLHAGEPIQHESDYFGTTVVLARRLCDAAAPGQILASDLVFGLAGARSGLIFTPVGQLSLKGFSEPVAAYEVDWRRGPPPASDEAALPLPPVLRLQPSFPFVGRSHELATLAALLPRAEGEGRRLALLAGEPGSGKSRLVRELGHEAAGKGALVLYGACNEAVRTPYRPFVESLDHLLRTVEPSELRADLGPAGGELTRLVPDLERRVGGLPAPVEGEPDSDRHRLYSALADLFARASRRRPLLVVLEDLHWADEASLLALRHLAGAAADARMLVVATFRDTEARVAPELSGALADLQRSEGVVRLRLAGLAGDEVAEFVLRAAGGEPGAELAPLAEALAELTGGNAFLLCELWRTLVETGALVPEAGGLRLSRPLAELASPESVREVVRERLRRLSPETTDLLEVAAVAGPEFELATLRRAASLGEADLLPALEEAERSGMIEELPARSLAYRFAHELVRRAIADRLSGPRRAELHLAVGRALEGASGDEAGRLPGLAHHFAAAAGLGVADRAVEYNLRAARLAMAALAYEEAAARLRTALELGISDAGARGEALLELGTASYSGGRTADALDAFREAAAVARERGDAELLARAAVGFEDAWWRPAPVERDAIELLEEAAEALGDAETPLRVMVLAGLSRCLARAGQHARASMVQAGAVAMARRLEDRALLAIVLTRSGWQLHTSGREQVLAQLAEARELAEGLDNVQFRSEAVFWLGQACVAMGDLAGAGREVRTLLEAAGKTKQPFMLHVAEHCASALALCEGRLDEAEERAERSLEWSRLLTGGWDASGVHGIQMFSVRREQGRLAEMAPVVRVLVGRGRTEGPWGPGLAAMLAELGMESDARAQLDAIRARGLDELRESLWLAGLTYLADACAAIGDARIAELVYPELKPVAGRPVMVGYLVACYGAADRYLGMLAATLGERELARAHFEAALELDRRMGGSTWLAHTAYEYGRMLLGGKPDDRAPAAALLAEADALAERIGMLGLRARIQALGAPNPGAPPLPDALSGREAQIVRLVARGLSNREIGGELSISEHTVANHVRGILRKTHCANRTEVAAYAVQHDLIATESRN